MNRKLDRTLTVTVSNQSQYIVPRAAFPLYFRLLRHRFGRVAFEIKHLYGKKTVYFGVVCDTNAFPTITNRGLSPYFNLVTPTGEKFDRRRVSTGPGTG